MQPDPLPDSVLILLQQKRIHAPCCIRNCWFFSQHIPSGAATEQWKARLLFKYNGRLDYYFADSSCYSDPVFESSWQCCLKSSDKISNISQACEYRWSSTGQTAMSTHTCKRASKATIAKYIFFRWSTEIASRKSSLCSQTRSKQQNKQKGLMLCQKENINPT